MKNLYECLSIITLVIGMFAGSIGIMFIQDHNTMYAIITFSIGVNFLLTHILMNYKLKKYEE